MGRRGQDQKPVEPNKESRYNVTKEVLQQEMYAAMSNPEKEKKLARFLEADFEATQTETSRVLYYLEQKRSEIFESKELYMALDIDLELSTYFSEPLKEYEYTIEYKTISKLSEEEALAYIAKKYNTNKDPDVDIKTILDRKLKYHKEMVKFLKSINQTRARKLIDFLYEARNS